MPTTAPRMPTVLAESAFELFGDRGFDQVTIDEIAAKAGVTKGSFYSHYKSKREIVLAACQHYYRTYQKTVHAALATLADPADRLRVIVEMSVRTCVVDRHTRVFTTEIFGLSLKDPQVRAGWLQFYDSVRELYVGLLKAVKEWEVGAGGDEERAAVDLMLAAIEGVKIRALYEPHIACDQEQEKIVEGLLAILMAPSYATGTVKGSTPAGRAANSP